MPHGDRFDGWLQRLFKHPAFSATCSTEQLYIDSYERLAYHFPPLKIYLNVDIRIDMPTIALKQVWLRPRSTKEGLFLDNLANVCC